VFQNTAFTRTLGPKKEEVHKEDEDKYTMKGVLKFVLSTEYYWNRDSPVGIATGYELEGSRNRVSILDSVHAGTGV
jgi:hypothetical protein